MKEYTSPRLYVIALLCGIVAIQTARFYLPFLGVVLIWPAFISSANAVRQIARYGLGTGTSSIGYWGTAVGATMAFISQFMDSVYAPYFAISSALVVGGVTGVTAQKIIRMKIPVMVRDSAILSSSTAIIAVFFLGIFSGPDASIVYPLIYIAITLAVLHPFNGSMGAGENQKRTLGLSAVEASMTTGLFGLVALFFSDTLSLTGAGIIVISVAGFLIFLERWYSLVKKDTYEMAWTGYPPAEH